jgi:hypothetical protein
MGGGAEFHLEAAERCGSQGLGEIRRQLALRCGLDVDQHVDRASAGKEPTNDLRRHCETGTRQLSGRHVGHDRFAVDQHAVAVKDEHGRSPNDRCPGSRSLPAYYDSRGKIMDAAIVEGRRVLGAEPLYTGCAQGIRIPQVMRCSMRAQPCGER